jgi:ABC-type transport system involved in cytochrome c biogenesis permease subunit
VFASDVLAEASIVLFWFALALYIAATVLYAYQFVLKRSKVGWWARFFTGAGFICQTLAIGARSQAVGTTEFTGANQLMLASWALVLLYFVMEHIIKIKIYGTFLIPVAAVMMMMARVVYRLAPPSALDPAQLTQLDSWRVAFHVALIVFANAGFAFGAVSAMIYLWQEAQLKKHRSTIVTRRLPSLATLQSVARRSISFAFPVYTAGLLLGILRAIEESVPAWWFDPRIMFSGVVWLIFGIYLLLVYRHDVSPRTSSWLAILGFVLVVILAVIARTVPMGFHVFGL